MALITIKEIRLSRIAVPLKNPFSTHLQTMTERESILVEMIGEDGLTGYGECVAFASPWYTEETVQSCWDALTNWLIPLVVGQELEQPTELIDLLASIKGNRMAKAALDQAVWDLSAKQKKLPLWRLLGGVRREISAGIVLTGEIDDKMYAEVQQAIELGYKRVKMKIDGQTDPVQLKKLVQTHPDTLFFADGNGIFDMRGLEALRKFDDVGFALIEQPFGDDQWTNHQAAAQVMKTPIALDESIRSVSDVERMIAMKAGSIIVLKPGRVGGITESLKIHELAKANGLPIWLGGMVEFGVSKAHNLALASLEQMTLPGDFSDSTHFWYEDPVTPPVTVRKGEIILSDESGIGYEINQTVMSKYVRQID